MKLILKFLFTIPILFLFSCMAGGTSGTGLSWGGGSTEATSTSNYGVRKQKRAIQYHTLKGRVENSNGSPLTRVAVSSTTSRSTERARTNARGQFTVLVVLEQGSSVNIEFSHSGRSWNTAISDIGGQEMLFRLMDNGDVRLSGNR